MIMIDVQGIYHQTFSLYTYLQKVSFLLENKLNAMDLKELRHLSRKKMSIQKSLEVLTTHNVCFYWQQIIIAFADILNSFFILVSLFVQCIHMQPNCFHCLEV